MTVEIADEDWEAIKASVLATVGVRPIDDLAEVVLLERAAAAVVKRIETERSTN